MEGPGTDETGHILRHHSYADLAGDVMKNVVLPAPLIHCHQDCRGAVVVKALAEVHDGVPVGIDLVLEC